MWRLFDLFHIWHPIKGVFAQFGEQTHLLSGKELDEKDKSTLQVGGEQNPPSNTSKISPINI